VPPELLPLDWLLDWMSAERVVALATMGQLVVLVVAALYARAQVREARELREDQARPFVVVDFEPWERPWINLVVTNVGRTMARNVRIEVDPPFESTLDRAVEVSMAQLKLFTEPIPSLAPGKRIEFLFDSLIDRRTAGLPTAYRVRLRYEGERGPLPPDEQYLDLDLYRFRIRVDRDSIHDVSVTLKKIERQFDKWTASFEGGLLVLSPEDQRRRNEDLRNWPDE
jgi:hypothetical protein